MTRPITPNCVERRVEDMVHVPAIECIHHGDQMTRLRGGLVVYLRYLQRTTDTADVPAASLMIYPLKVSGTADYPCRREKALSVFINSVTYRTMTRCSTVLRTKNTHF